MEFLDHSPCKGKKFQLVGGVVGFSLCQVPTNIGDDGISTIITSLVEDRCFMSSPLYSCLHFHQMSVHAGVKLPA